ncbi:MAG: ATP synthase F1 subunit epsilon [Pseudomonadota bacterium]
MKLDIVTPERQLLSAEVTSVQLPGMEGDMTVMEAHAPVITTLRPGILTVTGGDGPSEFVVTGGFAEIGETGTSVLAEQAVPRAEAAMDMIEAEQKAAETARELAPAEERPALDQRINDLGTLATTLGL